MDEKEIGLLIATKRERLGASQGALAKTIGVSRPYISQIESGAKKAGDQTLMKIMSALDISYTDLVSQEILDNTSKEEIALLNAVEFFSKRLAEIVSQEQFNEVMALFTQMQEAMVAAQALLKEEPMPAGPDGWLDLPKEDKRLVQRLVNRLRTGKGIPE